jgi:hypothetical protein
MSLTADDLTAMHKQELSLLFHESNVQNYPALLRGLERAEALHNRIQSSLCVSVHPDS